MRPSGLVSRSSGGGSRSSSSSSGGSSISSSSNSSSISSGGGSSSRSNILAVYRPQAQRKADRIRGSKTCQNLDWCASTPRRFSCWYWESLLPGCDIKIPL